MGTDGYYQDEFLRGDRPKDLFRGSIATPSIVASILNVKYVNSAPLHRIEQESSRNGVNISKQTMSNWMINSSRRYLAPLVECMKQELLKLPVTQSDGTPIQVLEYSCAMKSHFRKSGNQMSGKWKSSYARLLA